jgi:hypothetical protein
MDHSKEENGKKLHYKEIYHLRLSKDLLIDCVRIFDDAISTTEHRMRWGGDQE